MECAKIGIPKASVEDSSRLHTSAKYGIGVEGSRVVINGRIECQVQEQWQFYTPNCIVRLLVQMLALYNERIYDPCCGFGGMFVQSEKFVKAYGGLLVDISFFRPSRSIA
jgi:hypothetical protein